MKMSLGEAIADGVRRDYDGVMPVYFPKCHKCGEEVYSWSYQRGKKYTCQRCKTEIAFADKAKRISDNKETKDRKLKEAIRRLDCCTFSPEDYEEAIAAVQKNLYRDKWFQSTEEILVALELIKNGIKARHQVKMGRFCVDFLLPDEKVVLEVDGRIYHQGRQKEENLRDDLILLSLGLDWEVVRVGDDLINKNITRLVPAIRKIKQRRKVIRQNHGGMLPDWYSDKAV